MSMGPPPAREPSCDHDPRQPASACNECHLGKPLADWRSGWAAWFAEHPDDPRNPARTQTGDGGESRGGSLAPDSTSTVEGVTTLVIVGRWGDNSVPVVIRGLDTDDRVIAYRTRDVYARRGWSDVHIARETTSYERLP